MQRIHVDSSHKVIVYIGIINSEMRLCKGVYRTLQQAMDMIDLDNFIDDVYITDGYDNLLAKRTYTMQMNGDGYNKWRIL